MHSECITVIKISRLQTTRLRRPDLCLISSWPLALSEVKMVFDIQKHLAEEVQPLLLELLARLEHNLHVLHVLRRGLAELIKGLLVFLFGLKHKINDILNLLTCCINMRCPIYANMKRWANHNKGYSHKVLKLKPIKSNPVQVSERMENGHVKLNNDFGTQNHGIISRLQKQQ